MTTPANASARRRCSGDFAIAPVRYVLDMGCGTGGRALPLAARGCQVTGVARSADMIARALQKLAGRAPTPTPGSQQADLQPLELGRHFNAALMMFAVLGYQTTDTEVSAGLSAARWHLQPGRLLAFDVWYSPEMLSQRPPERAKVLDKPLDAWQRAAVLEMDSVGIGVPCIAASGRREPNREAADDHLVHHSFATEREQFLGAVGLELVHLSDLADLEAEASEHAWNVLACARTV